MKDKLPENFQKPQHLRFSIFMCTKFQLSDTHLSTLLAIHGENQEILTLIYMNSMQGKSGDCEGIVTPTNQYYNLSQKTYKLIKQTIQTDYQFNPDNNLCFNDPIKKRVIVANDRSDKFSEKLEELADAKTMLKICISNGAGDFLENYVQPHQMIQFLDASHDLQTEKDDFNCGLYSFDLMNAVVELLSDETCAERVMTLAKSLKTNSSADQELISIFREDLKSFLPCYYEANGAKKSREDIKRYHLQQRWDIGSKNLELTYPLKP